MKKKKIKNGKTRIEVRSSLYRIILRYYLRCIVEIGLNDERATHEGCRDAHLIRDELDHTLSRIFLLKYKLLNQLVPKSINETKSIHHDCESDCYNWGEDPD